MGWISKPQQGFENEAPLQPVLRRCNLIPKVGFAAYIPRCAYIPILEGNDMGRGLERQEKRKGEACSVLRHWCAKIQYSLLPSWQWDYRILIVMRTALLKTRTDLLVWFTRSHLLSRHASFTGIENRAVCHLHLFYIRVRGAFVQIPDTISRLNDREIVKRHNLLTDKTIKTCNGSRKLDLSSSDKFDEMSFLNFLLIAMAKAALALFDTDAIVVFQFSSDAIGRATIALGYMPHAISAQILVVTVDRYAKGWRRSEKTRRLLGRVPGMQFSDPRMRVARCISVRIDLDKDRSECHYRGHSKPLSRESYELH